MNCPTCNSELYTGQQVCTRCGTGVAHLTAPNPAGATTPTPGFLPPPVTSPFAQPPTAFNVVEQTSPMPAQDQWSGPAWQVGDSSPFATAPVPTAHGANAYQPTTIQPATPFQPTATQPAWGGLSVQPGAYVGSQPATGSVALAVVAAIAGVAAVIGSFLPMITISTDAPVGDAQTGDFKLNDLFGGTNVQVAVIVAGLALVAGGAIARFGKRFGAGLAGGAALALAPFVLWAWGNTTIISDGVEAQATALASGGRGGTFFEGKLGSGLYVLIGAAVVGVIALLVAFTASGPDLQKPLNRAICGGGALAAIVAGVGQLLPENGAEFSLNWDTDGGNAALTFGRLGIIAVVAIAGAAGFLLSSRWGIGLALGSVSAYVWQWISSLLEAGDFPTPPAFGNPGDLDLKPHIATTIGLIAMLVFAGLAFIAARSDVEVS